MSLDRRAGELAGDHSVARPSGRANASGSFSLWCMTLCMRTFATRHAPAATESESIEHHEDTERNPGESRARRHQISLARNELGRKEKPGTYGGYPSLYAKHAGHEIGGKAADHVLDRSSQANG
jgi:hypothetical protein